MKDSDLIFKGDIFWIDTNVNLVPYQEILYRIVSVEQKHFFAQEISTGSIFPIFEFWDEKSFSDEKMNDYFRIISNSYLKYGKFFVFGSVKGKKDKLEYYFDVDVQKTLHELVSVQEVNEYLEKREKDKNWFEELQEMENENYYFCDKELLKIKIAEARSEEHDTYIAPIDISEISKYGYDLSTQRNLCDAIGREKEIKKLIKAIAIREQSVLLVGESGSGKTAIVEKLAKERDDNSWLKGKIIFYLNTASLVADTEYRGKFEEKINKIIEFCRKNRGKIILFVDEVHTLYKLGSSEGNTNDAMNILKPYLSNGDIVMIGATTKKEYSEYIACDEAFCRRLEKIDVSVPDKDLNKQILFNYIRELETKYKVKFNFNDEETKKIIDYVLDITEPKNQRGLDMVRIQNPTISKHILDEAFAEVKYNKETDVNLNDICSAIIECDKISPTIRKEQAKKLKTSINIMQENVKVREEKVIPFVRSLKLGQ